MGISNPNPMHRSNFYLYNQLENLALKTGWELAFQWDQNVVHFSEYSELLEEIINFFSHGD